MPHIGEYVKLEIFVPVTHLEAVAAALRAAGAGAQGHYDSVISYAPVTGRWRPLDGAKPFLGEVGEVCEAEEYKVEARCRLDKLADTVNKVRAAHPYEAPVINALPLYDTDEA